MNILTVILNRVYCFLTKVKNQSPFLGSVILVALLINSLLNNIVLTVYVFKDKPLKDNGLIYFSVLVLILIIVYFYAIKRKNQIVEVKPSPKFNFLVASIFLFTLISFIWIANINRAMLSKEKPDTIVKPQKESLEGKIRNLFE